MKKILSLVLCLALLLCFAPAVQADESGACGDDLTWTFNSSTGRLTISGSGSMDNFDYSSAPWDAWKRDITEVLLPNGLTTIGDYAFINCSALTNIVIPGSVTTIGSCAFEYCSNLTSVAVPGSVTKIGESAFRECKALESASLSNGVTSIGKYAFKDCSKLLAMIIPNSVKNIKDSTFYGCSSLWKLVIGSGVTSIDFQAFYNCSSLRSVTIPEGVTSISGNAFQKCRKLTSVTLPSSLGSISNWAFDDTALTDVYYMGTEEQAAENLSIAYGNDELNDATWHYVVEPLITTQPQDVTAKEGDTAKFSVTVVGATKYQWQWSADGTTWKNSTSATIGYNTSMLQVSAMAARNGYEYRCKVTNDQGTTTSSIATLTVVSKPTITTQPKSVTTVVDSTAKFTVAASGTDLKYQWQWSADGGSTWKDSSSATTGYNTAALQVKATTARNGYRYRCQVSNAADTVISDVAQLTVTAISKPTITTQPKSVTASAGTTAKLIVAATGATSYQWQWSADGGSTWTNSSSSTTGYNTATLQVSATTARNGYKYRCKVTNTAGTTISDVAQLTVTAATKPTITTQPTNVTAYVGKTATFKVVATGVTSYQWQWSSDDGSTWTDSSSATTGYNTATLQVTATVARNGYKYRCKVTNSGGTTTSSAATLTVSEKPVITTQPKSVTATSGTTAKFTVTATGATSYQWQWSSDGGTTWKDSSSSTTGYNTATLQVSATAARNGYKYRCKVTNTNGTTTSSVATLTVN